MAVSAGTAFLDIAPRLQRTFSQTLTREMSGPATKSADRTGKEAGSRFGRGFSQGTRQGTRPAVSVFRALRGEMSNALGGRAAVAFGGAVVAAGLYKTVQAASDLNETINKTRVVFGPAAAVVERFGDTAATSLGLSRQQALEATATLGNLFVSMKLGQRPAADMSTRMVQLAGDLASFNNADPSEVLEALRAGLVGETEPLRRFGVNLNDAALKAEAMRLGLGKVGPTLTASQRAQAAYSLILQQSKTAQGDFARTSGGLANQQRILAAEFKDAQAALGEQLLPAMLSGVRIANRLLDGFAGLNRATGGLAAQGLLAAGGLTVVGIGVLKLAGYIKIARDAWVAYRATALATAAADAVLTRQQILLGLSTAGTGTAAATAGAKFVAFGAYGAAAAAVLGTLTYNLNELKSRGLQDGRFLDPASLAIKKIGQLFGLWKDKTAEQTGAQAANNQATGQAKAAQDAYAQALAAVGGKQADTTAKTEELTGKLKELKDGFRTQVEAVRDSIESYDGLIAKSGVTATQVVADLHNQVANFKTYASDAQRLIKAGVSPAAIQELSKKGPQYVHALATGSNRELQTYKRYWRDRQAEVRGSFAESMQRQYDNLVKKIKAMQAEINKLKGKTVDVTAEAQVEIKESTRQGLLALGIKGYGTKFFAKGGLTHLGDTAIVGEEGPELVQFQRPARVYPADETRRILGRGMAAGGIVGGFLDPATAATRRYGDLAAQRLGDMAGRRLADVLAKAVTDRLAPAGFGAVGARISGPIAAIVRGVAARYGWGSGAQWSALSWIISHESGWRPTAQNPTSSAYGLFQFLNGTWAGVGGHKTADPYLQSVYGLRYVKSRYGTPLGAQSFWQSHGWYDDGGWLLPGTTLATNTTGRPERVLGPNEPMIDYRRLGQEVARALRENPPVALVSPRAVQAGMNAHAGRMGQARPYR